METFTAQFEKRLLVAESKLKIHDVRLEVELPQHILKMSAKVERRTLEKCEKDKLFEMQSLAEKQLAELK
jgi:hypothetical protein